MTNPTVVALDIGSSSVRAMLFDTTGREVFVNAQSIDAQVKFDQRTTADGGVEVDADLLVQCAVTSLDLLLRQVDACGAEIAAVGISCFWHSLVGVGADGNAVTPVFSWADTRSKGHVAALAHRFHPLDYHAWSGCELHPCFWPAKLLWLREANPGAYSRVQTWMGFGEYLISRLFGRTHCSFSMASGTGLLDQQTVQWNQEILEFLDLDPTRLPELRDCDAAVTGLRPEYRDTLAALSTIPWYPAVGDGASSNIGSGAVNRRRIALNCGTSAAMRVIIPAEVGAPLAIGPALFCYRVDREHVLYGGAFANGGNVHAWLKETLNWGDDDAFSALVGAVSPDAHGLTVLPFWAGERSPGWHSSARASILGMNLHTTAADIVRASLEACAYSFDTIRERLHHRFDQADEIIVSGGAFSKSPIWAQIVADVFGVPVVMSEVAEASARGAAIIALRGLGHLDSLEKVPVLRGQTFLPDPRNAATYQKGCERYQEAYREFLK